MPGFSNTVDSQRYARVAGLVGGVLLLVLMAIAAGCVGLFLKDFVVPIMYLRRVGVMAAWGEFHRYMLADHVGTFVLYILFKMVIAMVIAIIIVIILSDSSRF